MARDKFSEKLEDFTELVEETTLQRVSDVTLVCRICLEGSELNNELISACRCAGSVKFVHESCVKTWILSKEKEIDEAQCELCKTKFKMEYKMNRECSCEQTCKDHLEQTVFGFSLFIIVFLLSVIVYMLISRIDSKSVPQEIYTISLIAICLVGIVILLVIIFHSFRTAFSQTSLADWKILPQSFPEQFINSDQIHTSQAPMEIPETILVKGVQLKTSSILKRLATPKNRRNFNSSRHRMRFVFEPDILSKRIIHNRSNSLQI